MTTMIMPKMKNNQIWKIFLMEDKMEKDFGSIFGAVRHERSLILLLSLTDERI